MSSEVETSRCAILRLFDGISRLRFASLRMAKQPEILRFAQNDNPYFIRDIQIRSEYFPDNSILM
jgi:hypothetical protein